MAEEIKETAPVVDAQPTKQFQSHKRKHTPKRSITLLECN